MKYAACIAAGLAALTLSRPAICDVALSFDGVDDCARVPYDTSFPTEVFTVSAWIKLVPPQRRAAIIARGEDDNSFNLSWQLFVNPDGTLVIMLENANEQNFCYPDTCMGEPQASCTAGDLFVADDQWHHVAATRDAGGALALYVDGQPQAGCTATGVPSANNQQVLSFGCTHGTIGPPPGGVEPPVWFFTGLIDSPAMWNLALSQAEMQDVFLNGVHPASPGLVGYWEFNESSGQVVVDLSPAGNDGFLGTDSDPGGDSADPQWVDECPPNCVGDLDNNNQVDLADLAQLLSNFGVSSGATPQDGDLNGDGAVDLEDLALMLSEFRTICS